jgi:hypothetical protein
LILKSYTELGADVALEREADVDEMFGDLRRALDGFHLKRCDLAITIKYGGVCVRFEKYDD